MKKKNLKSLEALIQHKIIGVLLVQDFCCVSLNVEAAKCKNIKYGGEPELK